MEEVVFRKEYYHPIVSLVKLFEQLEYIRQIRPRTVSLRRLGVGEGKLRISEGRNRHGIVFSGFEQRVFIAVAGLHHAVGVQHTVLIQGNKVAHRTVMADDFLFHRLLRAFRQNLHMLQIFQVVRHDLMMK